ncbi:MAG: DUF5362 family protein [Prosthecobacter sp.]
MEANPYSTPAANLYGTTGGDVVSPGTIAQLAGTKPWVRFISVLMWLATIVVILAAIVTLLTGASGMAQTGGNAAYNAGMMTGMAIYYCVVAFVMIYPSMKLWKYANCIGRLVASHSTADLDAALTEQRRYWKFTGILVIISICLAVIGMIAMLALGFSIAKAAGAGF